jgi:hypothetical protein
MVRSVLLVALIVAVMVTLATALVTRDGVGPTEYVVGAALLVVLLVALFRVSLGAIRHA